MTLYKDVAFGKQNFQGQNSANFITSHFIASNKSSLVDQITTDRDTNLIFNFPIIEWQQSDLVKMENFLKNQHLPVTIKVKLNNEEEFYIFPENTISRGLTRSLTSLRVKVVDNFEVFSKNKILTKSLVSVVFDNGRKFFVLPTKGYEEIIKLILDS